MAFTITLRSPVLEEWIRGVVRDAVTEAGLDLAVFGIDVGHGDGMIGDAADVLGGWLDEARIRPALAWLVAPPPSKGRRPATFGASHCLWAQARSGSVGWQRVAFNCWTMQRHLHPSVDSHGFNSGAVP